MAVWRTKKRLQVTSFFTHSLHVSKVSRQLQNTGLTCLPLVTVGLLKGGPESHVDLVDKLQKNFKNNSKALTNVSREMASKEVKD